MNPDLDDGRLLARQADRASVLRQPDTGRGVVWTAEDFDAPLPDDLLDAFEGRP